MIKPLILMVNLVTFCCFQATAAPEYFTPEVDQEYRSLIFHVDKMLPKTNLPLAYLPSFSPFNILDVRPLNFTNKDKQSFANFNFGVLGSRFLNVDKQTLSALPSLSICNKNECQDERLKTINAFLMDAEHELANMTQDTEVVIVQQTDINVFRVNNTFFSPTVLITYLPSEHAGFVPSSKFQVVENLDEAPELMALANRTHKLREIMSNYNVAAITQINNTSLNVIFGGLADNHWGAVINEKAHPPMVDEYNHLGLKYAVVKKLSGNNYYYQTN